MSSDTQQRLERAIAGERGAFGELAARHRGRLLAFLRARRGPRLSVELEDVLQETLLEAARKIGGFEARAEDPSGGFYAWLVAIARLKLAEAERAAQAAKRAHAVELGDAHEHPGTSPSAAARRSEARELALAALAQLPERQAEALRLRYLEGLSVAETGARLGVGAPAVKALVARGIGELGARLAKFRTDSARPVDESPP